MQNVWNRRADETEMQYLAFQFFCQGNSYSQIIKNVAPLNKGNEPRFKSKSGINFLLKKFDWEKRRAAYQMEFLGDGKADCKMEIQNLNSVISDTTVAVATVEGVQEVYNPPPEETVKTIGSEASLEAETALVTSTLPAPTLQQRVIKIQFHLQNMANSAIIIGQELTECKKQVPHGEWLNWLKSNFNLSQSMASNFMRIAERFGNYYPGNNLNQSQLIALLALPAGEEENFLKEMEEQGTPFKDMTKREANAAVKDWKAEYEKEKEKVENLFAKFEQQKQNFENANQKLAVNNAELRKDNGRLQAKFDAADKLANQYHAERDILQKQLQNQKPLTVEPADYQQLKKSCVQFQNKIDALQKQLANKQVEIVTPSDYEENKKELARLQAAQSEMVQRMEVFQNLGTIAALMNYVITSPSYEGVQDFKREHPDTFGKMCAAMLDFTDSFYEE